MGLLSDCEAFFGTQNLYEAFTIKKEASNNDIKKAYRRLSLLIHPDRVSDAEKDKATKKFQVLGKIHAVLSDKDKRSLYDETGAVDDEDTILSDRDWTDYWRHLFPKITPEDICKYLEEYQGSPEEAMDLKAHYERFEGDFNLISDCLIGYDFEDEGRYRQMLQDMIDAGEVEAFPKFTKESKRKRAARKARYANEAKEADEELAARGLSDGMSLHQIIAQRQQSREAAFDGLMSSLEARYCKPKPKKSKKGSK
ncbi:dnaJ homolog subfamily C member 9-like [Ornithodoros turicata]|uniref:dnaJ homolog subfamily C member 9-like n=1 Tax=Ornithodoros turicata TaxID=34597 RepID=UPI003138F2EE